MINIALHLILFIGFAIQAWYDWKYKEIPDLVTATMLFVIMVTSFSEYAYWGLFVFMIAFFTNSLVVHITKKPYLGWGDILIMPNYAIVLVALGGTAWFAGISACFIAFALSYCKKERLALVPFMFLFYIIALVLTFL